MMRSLSILACLLWCQVAIAELTVDIKKATTVVTSVTTDSTQLATDGGDRIGDEVTTQRPPVVSKGQPVAVMILNSPIGFEKLKVKARCDTAPVKQVLPNVYFVDQVGTHIVRFDSLSIEPFSWDDATVTVTVGIAPGPGPGPGPGPSPGPSVAPIEGVGFRVLFVSESGTRMPRSVEESFYSPEISQWLNSVCHKVDGQPEFRRLDPDAQFTDVNHRFAKALNRPRTADPWLIISNGVSGYEGPFPATKAETFALLQKYLPNQYR